MAPTPEFVSKCRHETFYTCVVLENLEDLLYSSVEQRLTTSIEYAIANFPTQEIKIVGKLFRIDV